MADRIQDELTRRDVLRSALGAAGTVATGGLPLRVVPPACGAQPDSVAPQRLIPADKSIPATRIAELWQRGTQRVYRGNERATIGMPCGGIGAGQLYVLGDGRLGHWGIDGEHRFSGYGADNYRTFTPPRPVEQGFALAVRTPDGRVVPATLDDEGFDAIEFEGEYPVARVRYRATPGRNVPPVEVDLEVFSPFVPLDARASAWPATVLRFTVRNASLDAIEVALGGWLENMVFGGVPHPIVIQRRNRAVKQGGLTSIVMDAVEQRPAPPARPTTRVLYDFESGTYAGWQVEGQAFGGAPAEGTHPNQNPVSGFEGRRLVNSYTGGDAPTGRLTSEPFDIDLPYLTFLIGGGAHAGRTCMNLLIDGAVVRSAAGRNSEKLERRVWDLREFAGRRGHLEIVDQATGGWGHVNVDQIALTDVVPEDYREFDPAAPGFGSAALTLVGAGRCMVDASGPEVVRWLEAFGERPARRAEASFRPPEEFESFQRAGRLTGGLRLDFPLAPGESRDLTFIVSWHFPNLHTGGGVMYANWFADALDVAQRFSPELDGLRERTLRFCDAYYRGTTLPWWLATRLMMPVSTLATGTCQWWKNGRFWGWEGVGCCAGTCTHVWNYSQADAWLFPELARSTRTMQDLGQGYHNSGLVGFRSDHNYAADGQAGTVLKCYREHLLSRDDAFLRTHWPRIRNALEFLIAQDRAAPGSAVPGGGATAGEGPPGTPEGEPDGIIENSQHNTFDINFVGPNTFVGALYLAALLAAERMALRMDDPRAAQRYRAIFDAGSRWTVDHLYNGEYFEQRLPPGHDGRWQYAGGCLSDQLFGQNWAHLLGLGYLYPPEYVRSALQAVFKYNWAPDVAALNATWPPERWFARPGEGGLFTCTWPRGGRPDEPVRYRDEVWTGIEYQVAAGMIWEGLIAEATAVLRAVDERYDPARHNPWNEVECGDHYARAMASWGVLLALAGFGYDGPSARLRFAPRVQPDEFACFFSAATGWGTVAQRRAPGQQLDSIRVRFGELLLGELELRPPPDAQRLVASAAVVDAGAAGAAPGEIPARASRAGPDVIVRLDPPLRLAEGRQLVVRLEWA